MSSAEHTAGPWWVSRPERILDCKTHGAVYIHAKDVTIALVLDGEKEANASLISASPDLLTAAIDVLSAYGTGMASLPIGSPKREALRRLCDARDKATRPAP